MTTLDAVLDHQAPAPAPAGAVPYRVLVADDEPSVLDAVGLLLSTHDLSAVPARTPAEALDRAAAEPLDAALVDLNYDPGRTTGEQGLELIASLHKRAPSLPIVAMTAWSSIELALEAVRRGARDFVQKPFDEARLVSLLRSQAELGRALRRVGELELEVRQLKLLSGGDDGSLPTLRLLEVEGLLVRRAMDRFGGNVSRAAKALGLSRSALYRRLDRHTI
jgi:DNA-binding NtrC family response regulator